MKRRTIGWLSALVVLLAGGGFGLSRALAHDPGLTMTVKGRPGPVPTGALAGPATGSLAPVWQVTGKSGTADRGALFTGNEIVTGGVSGIVGYDTRTGRTLWTIGGRDVGRISHFTVIGDTAITFIGDPADLFSPAYRWTAFDTRTGKVRWTAKDTTWALGDAFAGPVTTGDLPAIGPTSGVLFGLDPLTGRRAWTLGPPGCVLDHGEGAYAAGGGLLVIPAQCGRPRSFLGVDLRDGKVAWKRPSTDPTGVSPILVEGVAADGTSAVMDRGIYILGPDGRLVARLPDENPIPYDSRLPTIQTSGGLAVAWVQTLFSKQTKAFVVDLRSGSARYLDSPTLYREAAAIQSDQAIAFAGGRLSLTTADSFGTLKFVNVASNSTTSVQLPGTAAFASRLLVGSNSLYLIGTQLNSTVLARVRSA